MIAVGEILRIPFHQSNLKLGSWEIGILACGLSEFLLTLWTFWTVRTYRCCVSFGFIPRGDRRWCLDKGNLSSWALGVLWRIVLYHKSLLTHFTEDPRTHLNFNQAVVTLMHVICKYQPECLSVAYQSYFHHLQLQPSAIQKGLVWLHYCLQSLFHQWLLELQTNSKQHI